MKTQNQKIRELNKTLKSLGYIKSSKVENWNNVYFDTYKSVDGTIYAYIYNCHNDYTNKSIDMFRDVGIQLIKQGYEIKMLYPCRIGITNKHE